MSYSAIASIIISIHVLCRWYSFSLQKNNNDDDNNDNRSSSVCQFTFLQMATSSVSSPAHLWQRLQAGKQNSNGDNGNLTTSQLTTNSPTASNQREWCLQSACGITTSQPWATKQGTSGTVQSLVGEIQTTAEMMRDVCGMAILYHHRAILSTPPSKKNLQSFVNCMQHAYRVLCITRI